MVSYFLQRISRMVIKVVKGKTLERALTVMVPTSAAAKEQIESQRGKVESN